MHIMIRVRRLTLLVLLVPLLFFSISRGQQPSTEQHSTLQKIAYEANWYNGDLGGGGSFVEGAENGATARTRANLYVKDPIESKPRWIDEGEFPSWSPDGSRLAYCTTIGINYGQIRVVNANGKGKRQLTHLNTGACFPEWSPDGKEIAITLFEASSKSVAIVDENGTLLRKLGAGREAHWSPDGKQLLFLRPMPHSQIGSSIWIMQADGSDAREILEDNSRFVQASWLQRGAGILFSSERDGLAAIYTADLEGKKVRKIGGDPLMNWYRPAESPDGGSLIVDTATPDDAPVLRLSVVQLVARTRSVRMLAAGGNHFSAFWSQAGEANAPKEEKKPPPAP